MKFNQKTIGAGLFVIAAIAGGVGYKAYTNYQEEKIKSEAKAKADAEEAKRKATPHWEFVSSSKSGTNYWIQFPPKSEFTAANEPIKSVWVKSYEKGGKGYTLAYESFECKNESYYMSNVVKYDENGKITYNSGTITDNWTKVLPDTIAKMNLDAVCNY